MIWRLQPKIKLSCIGRRNRCKIAWATTRALCNVQTSHTEQDDCSNQCHHRLVHGCLFGVNRKLWSCLVQLCCEHLSRLLKCETDCHRRCQPVKFPGFLLWRKLCSCLLAAWRRPKCNFLLETVVRWLLVFVEERLFTYLLFPSHAEVRNTCTGKSLR